MFTLSCHVLVQISSFKRAVSSGLMVSEVPAWVLQSKQEYNFTSSAKSLQIAEFSARLAKSFMNKIKIGVLKPSPGVHHW